MACEVQLCHPILLMCVQARVVAHISSEPTNGEVTTDGVVNAVLRFQGVLLASRADVAQCTSRIFEKVTQLLLKDTGAEN
jgi:hypothetical protein